MKVLFKVAALVVVVVASVATFLSRKDKKKKKEVTCPNCAGNGTFEVPIMIDESGRAHNFSIITCRKCYGAGIIKG